MAGRISIVAGQARDRIETTQAILPGLMANVSEAQLRIRQAMRRSSQVYDVLAPAVERLDQVLSDLRLIQQELQVTWSDGQERRWRNE